jgi:hypothetical protein
MMIWQQISIRFQSSRREFRRRGRSAFTLFEVILAIALSTLLLALIGMAINLFLTRIEARRSDVEWAQLARQIFAVIGEDLRAASEYRPQDTTGALIAVSNAASNVSQVLGQSGQTGQGGPTGQTSQTGQSQQGGATGQAGGTTGQPAAMGVQAGFGMGGVSMSTGVTTGTPTSTDGTTVLPSLLTTPGIHGNLLELVIDACRPSRLEDLFRNRTGYANALALPPAAPTGRLAISRSPQAIAALQAPQGDLKTVRYYVRKGTAIDPNSIDVTSFSPDAQNAAGGLVRQEIDRAKRVLAEQAGNTALMELTEVLLAPEVTALEFRYFDGATVFEAWEMQSMGVLPIGVEIRLWLADPQAMASPDAARGGTAARTENAREFRQMVFLPAARPPHAAATTATGTTTGTGTGTSTGSTSGI